MTKESNSFSVLRKEELRIEGRLYHPMYCSDGKVYFSVPEAAKLTGFHRTYLLILAQQGYYTLRIPKEKRIPLQAWQDAVTGDYRIGEDSIKSLRERCIVS